MAGDSSAAMDTEAEDDSHGFAMTHEMRPAPAYYSRRAATKLCRALPAKPGAPGADWRTLAQDRTQWCMVSASFAAHQMAPPSVTFGDVRSATGAQMMTAWMLSDSPYHRGRRTLLTMVEEERFRGALWPPWAGLGRLVRLRCFLFCLLDRPQSCGPSPSGREEEIATGSRVVGPLAMAGGPCHRGEALTRLSGPGHCRNPCSLSLGLHGRVFGLAGESGFHGTIGYAPSPGIFLMGLLAGACRMARPATLRMRTRFTMCLTCRYVRKTRWGGGRQGRHLCSIK